MKTVTVTIDENGDMLFLKNETSVIFLDLGEVKTRRASHVEPDNSTLRVVFHVLRFVFGETGIVSDFTRRWRCLWRVNTAPVGGPILTGRWRDRQEAIVAEIEFLNRFFAR